MVQRTSRTRGGRSTGGVTFREGAAENEQPKRDGYTVWSPFAAETDYFSPSDQDFMINFRVHDLDSLLAQLRADGGYFGWMMDPEGNRVELWEPPLA